MAAYVPAVRTGDLIFTAGQVPRQDGEIMFPGAVGGPVSPENARKAAMVAAVQALAAVKSISGSLEQ